MKRERSFVVFAAFTTTVLFMVFIVKMRKQDKELELLSTQKLWCDGTGCIPGGFDGSFGTSPEDYDGSEDAVMFNGADAEGSSWRGLVPVVVWPEQRWFDDDGNYLGLRGGRDKGRTTVTR